MCKQFSQVRHVGEKRVPCPARRRKLERMCSPEPKEKHCRKGKIRIATNCKAVYSCRLFMHNCQSCLFSLDNERFFYSSERVAGHWFLWRIKSIQTIVSARTGNMKRFLNVGFAVFAGVMVLYMLEFHLLEGHRQYFLLAFFTPSNKTQNISISRNSSRAAEVKSSKIRIDHYVPVSDPTFAGKTFEMDNETFRIVQDFLKENVFKRKPVKLNPKAS